MSFCLTVFKTFFFNFFFHDLNMMSPGVSFVLLSTFSAWVFFFFLVLLASVGLLFLPSFKNVLPLFFQIFFFPISLSSLRTSVAQMLDWHFPTQLWGSVYLFSVFFSVCFSWIVLIALSSSLLIFFPAVSKLLFNLSREFHYTNILFISSGIYTWIFFIDFFWWNFTSSLHPLL